jgi:glycosyltransferase involved in cell wall biosynthesis
MIPAYNPNRVYLEQTLNSVLSQDPGPDKMQIEVVDDASPNDNVEGMVREIGGGRVSYFRSPANLGLAGCWNRCIERACGGWVHILHQDDYVLPQFYDTLGRAAEAHPDVGLIFTRSFYVDDWDVILGVSERVKGLEGGGRAVENFFYTHPIHCPGVVVKRPVYGELGGFRSDLSYALDVEMWTRIIGLAGGLSIPQVLSCYRVFHVSETSRLARSGETVRDLDRLNRLFAERYPDFDKGRALRDLSQTALNKSHEYAKTGDIEAAKAHLAFWNAHATLAQRARQFGKCMLQHLG